jgi:hypothetical protein
MTCDTRFCAIDHWRHSPELIFTKTRHHRTAHFRKVRSLIANCDERAQLLLLQFKLHIASTLEQRQIDLILHADDDLLLQHRGDEVAAGGVIEARLADTNR